jgi:hypothetical protein
MFCQSTSRGTQTKNSGGITPSSLAKAYLCFNFPGKINPLSNPGEFRDNIVHITLLNITTYTNGIFRCD